MDQYERDIQVEAPAGTVFAMVSRIENLARFVPTVQDAELVGRDRVRLTGVARGRSYQAESDLLTDAQNHRMEWGRPPGYHGWLEIRRGDTSAAMCEVTVHLNVPAPPGQQDESAPNQREEEVQALLWEALTNIRRLVTEEQRKRGRARGTRG